MNSTTKIAAAIAAAALIAYLAWSAGRASNPALDAAGTVGSFSSAPESQNERLDRLDQRLDRLESLLARQAGRPNTPAMIGNAAIDAHAVHQHEASLTPEQQEQQLQLAMNQMESKFLTEPVVSAWSSSTEGAIANSFSPKNLSALGAPSPRSQQTSCRSSTCRIQVTYADDAQADIGQQFLLYDITARLPVTSVFRVPQPDGSVAMVIYASGGNGRR